ncbi:MAG: cell division protein FtsB [Candidatus Thiodiazotropha sp. (ex Dulcina madagascariensis)]|nr:cell division protein FtsB [Candidatus Thiodiazotropha sp. (ex Dulcina madagascariensis)]
MRIVIAILIVLLLFLQYRLWVGEGSLAEVNNLEQEIKQLKQELVGLRERNSALQAEVEDLRSGQAAIEERARSELGMIKEGEIFYQVIGPSAGGSDER